MKYGIYLDVFWMTNFVMDFIALIFVRFLKKGRRPFWRLFLGAVFGSTATAFFFLTLHHYGLYQLLIHLLINPLMLIISFPAGNLRGFVKDYLLVYVVMMFLGGILNWGQNTLLFSNLWIWVLGGCVICCLTLYFLETKKMEQQVFEVLLQTPLRNIKLKGFYDTGNLLTDPLVNQPVHIIQEKLLDAELTKELLAMRFIPYHSLGQEQGLLPVVTLKGMYIIKAGTDKGAQPLYIEKPVLGLAKEKLFQRKEYQMILNAKCG